METTTPPQTVDVTTVSQYMDTPMVVALVFALAGAFFIGILLLRRRRTK